MRSTKTAATRYFWRPEGGAAVDSGLRRLIDALETRQMPAWKAFKGKTHLAGQKVTAGKLIYTLRAQISQEYGY